MINHNPNKELPSRGVVKFLGVFTTIAMAVLKLHFNDKIPAWVLFIPMLMVYPELIAMSVVAALILLAGLFATIGIVAATIVMVITGIFVILKD